MSTATTSTSGLTPPAPPPPPRGTIGRRSRIALAVTLAAALVLAVLVAVVAVVRDPGEPAEASTSAALERVDWAPDDWTRDRVLDDDTRRTVGAAYATAWQALAQYTRIGDTGPVDLAFDDVLAARIAATRPVDGAIDDRGHTLTLDFFARDGATIAFTDRAEVERTIEGFEPLRTEERYEVVMVLEDGYWRVAQFARQPAP